MDSGLSKDVQWSILGQMAQNGRSSKFKVWNELTFFRDLHSKVDLFRTPVSHFKLWRPAIFEPFDLGYSNIRLLKALSPFYWNLKWKWEYLGSERPQTKFSEGGAFLVNWAVAPPGWCHTQFLYKFWKLCVRAFKWYLICGFFLLESSSNGQNKKPLI